MSDVNWHRWNGEKLKGRMCIVSDGKRVACGWYDHLRMIWLLQVPEPIDVDDCVETNPIDWEPTHYATLTVEAYSDLKLP